MSPSFPDPVGGRAKRTFDLAITVPVLILLAPVFVIIAILIRARLPRARLLSPDASRARRAGIPGDSSSARWSTGRSSSAPGLHNDAGDPRITPLGARLRALSLDELPQLINVLIGDMSIVGPRPTLRDQVELYTPEQRRRLRARPGITGLAQISGRSTLPWSRRIVIDVHYVDNWSLRLDLEIIARTIPALLRKDETYPGGIDEVDLG